MSQLQLMLRGESSSNSSNASSRWTFHVFLSFRGQDTRVGFTNHLYAALVRKGIITFLDDIQLEKGDVISQELLKSIEESLATIVVLSENYASSAWCLVELQKILESRRVLGREVFPVFYGVSPCDVLDQRNNFGKDLEKHARRYKEDKVQKWRDSLREVAGIPGWEFKNQDEAGLIEDIVESVWTKLRPKLPSYDDGLVGIDSRVKKMDSLLKIGLPEVRFRGLCGMGGIGKTTLATVVFNKIRDQFDICCFLNNVREISGERDGMLHLQRKLISHLKIKGLEIKDLDEGKNRIRNLLSKKKVLLVLDDVGDISQIKSLAEKKEWFGPGSRVIITTRDIQVLKSWVSPLDVTAVESYKIDLLNSDESLQLLCQKAFKRDKPPEHYVELSKKVVQYAGGLPLALKLLGSFLCGRIESHWKEVVAMIRQVPPNDIVKKSLRISYNGLPDHYKTLFLDIACFFKGGFKELVIQKLKICDRYPSPGIEFLIEKSVATCDDHEMLGMHDLLQETGRDIVIEECPIDAGKRSRLWSLEHLNQVLKYNKATESIQGIVLNSSTESYEATWDPKAFSKMSNLRLLICNYPLELRDGLKCLCSSLKYLQWQNYPMEALPLGAQLDELVDLRMNYSKIIKIWDENQSFANLKYIDLCHSKDLIQTPIVSGAPCLQSMLLHGCINLVEVHQSIGRHEKLVLLSMKGCINLRTLPRKLEMASLEKLILSGCTKVKKLPEFGTNMECLSELRLENCKNLLCLPKTISNLKSLRRLDISGCSRFSRLPDNMNKNESLEELDVSGTAIREISSSQVRLEKLKELSFGGKIVLASNSWNLLQWISKFRRQPVSKDWIMPPLSHLLGLTSLDLSYCNLKSILDDLGSLSMLQSLDLSGNYFVELPAQCISNLYALEILSLTNIPTLESLPMLPPNIQCLYTTNSTQIELNLDEQMLWKMFESHMNQMEEDGPDLWVIIKGREIPSWFDNQNYLSIDPSHHPYNTLGCDSVASIIVDVPEYCQSSEWWGIAVCVALEPINMSSASRVRPAASMGNEEMCIYYWSCKSPDREPDPGFPIGPKYGLLVYESSDSYIHIIFLTSDHIYIQHYLGGEQNQLQLIFYVENLSKSWKTNINKCGCRVLCKEDIEDWLKGSSGLNILRLSEMNNDERIRSHDELDVEEPTSSNAHAL